MKKRFITIAVKYSAVAMGAFAETVGIRLGNDAYDQVNKAYDWAKSQLQKKGVPHQESHAASTRELPYQNGYISFYLDNNGKWVPVNH